MNYASVTLILAHAHHRQCCLGNILVQCKSEEFGLNKRNLILIWEDEAAVSSPIDVATSPKIAKCSIPLNELLCAPAKNSFTCGKATQVNELRI